MLPLCSWTGRTWPARLPISCPDFDSRGKETMVLPEFVTVTDVAGLSFDTDG